MSNNTKQTVKNIIKLNEDYGIGADDLNIVLYQRKVNNTKTSDNYGKEYYSAVGYYGNIESLLKNLVNKQIMLEAAQQKSLDDLVSNVDKYISLLFTDISSIVKELKRD